MSIESKHIHTGEQPTLFTGVVGPLTPSGSATNHTHPDLQLLNSLNLQDNKVLRINEAPINPPLTQKDW